MGPPGDRYFRSQCPALRAVAKRIRASAASSVMMSLPGARAMCCRMFRVSSRRTRRIAEHNCIDGNSGSPPR